MADTFDLEIPQGGRLRMTFVNADENEVAVPIPAEYEAHMQVRDKVGGTVMLDADSDQIGGITLDRSAGEVILDIGADKTALVTKSGLYDIFLFNPNDAADRELFIEGKAPLNKGITVE